MTPKLTISSYDVHHLVGRFVKLYRRVQVVSNCLTFACSMLCCQCWAMLPENPIEAERKVSAEGVMFLPQHVIEARKAGGEPLRRADQELFIYREDTVEAQEKCMQFWKMVNSNPKLPKDPSKSLANETSRVEPIASSSRHNVMAPGEELPAIHTISKNAVVKCPARRRVSFTKC